jgi:O-antigen/teichoic acid export membrane protein
LLDSSDRNRDSLKIILRYPTLIDMNPPFTWFYFLLNLTLVAAIFLGASGIIVGLILLSIEKVNPKKTNQQAKGLIRKIISISVIMFLSSLLFYFIKNILQIGLPLSPLIDY